MASFPDSLLNVSSHISSQDINRLKRGRKPSPWPTEALTGLWVCGTETTLQCLFLHSNLIGILPWSDPAHKHTRWIERFSRCSVGAFPGEQHSADTTAGSRQLPWKLGDKHRTNLQWLQLMHPATTPFLTLNIEEGPYFFRSRFSGKVFWCLNSKDNKTPTFFHRIVRGWSYPAWPETTDAILTIAAGSSAPALTAY